LKGQPWIQGIKLRDSVTQGGRGRSVLEPKSQVAEVVRARVPAGISNDFDALADERTAKRGYTLITLNLGSRHYLGNFHGSHCYHFKRFYTGDNES
jgi:hypothetical protein